MIKFIKLTRKCLPKSHILVNPNYIVAIDDTRNDCACADFKYTNVYIEGCSSLQRLEVLETEEEILDKILPNEIR